MSDYLGWQLKPMKNVLGMYHIDDFYRRIESAKTGCAMETIQCPDKITLHPGHMAMLRAIALFAETTFSNYAKELMELLKKHNKIEIFLADA